MLISRQSSGWEPRQLSEKHYRDIRIISNNGAICVLLLSDSKGEAYQVFSSVDAELEKPWLCLYKKESQNLASKQKIIPVPIIAEKGI